VTRDGREQKSCWLIVESLEEKLKMLEDERIKKAQAIDSRLEFKNRIGWLAGGRTFKGDGFIFEHMPGKSGLQSVGLSYDR